MASTEDRVRKLIGDNLEVDGQPIDSSLPLDSKLMDVGVSSTDLVAFAKVLQDEFGVTFAPEDCVEVSTIGGLVEYLDSKAA